MVNNGFAASNVALGVGSFSMQCLESYEEHAAIPRFNPYTRDTFGIAIKATYAEDKDGKPIMIFKNPKEASFKKSHKGCVLVLTGADGALTSEDEHDFKATYRADNALKTVFNDGKMVLEYSLADIRKRLYGDNF